MKYLSISIAALFIVASPLAAVAQSSGGSGAGSGSNTGGGSGNNSGGSGNNDAGNIGRNSSDETTGSIGSQKSDCSDVVAGALYKNFSEKCRSQIDKWAGEQDAGRNIHYEGDIDVGTVLPKSVEIIEVPAYRSYGYVMLNNKRVLVDRDTRKVVRVY